MRLVAGLGAGLLVYIGLGVVFGVRVAWQPFKHRGRHGGGRRRGAAWQDWIHQADASLSVRQVIGLSAVVAIGAGLLVRQSTGIGSLATLAALGASGAPVMVLAQRRRQQMAERTGAWPDALRDLITHLRANLSLHAGLGQLAVTGPLPLRSFFRRYEQLAGALDRRAALEVVREELADPLSDRIIEVLLVAFEQGPSVVIDILEDLAAATVDDLRLVEEVKTSQLETKLEARAAAALPFVVLGLLCGTSDDYRAFYQTTLGWMVVVLGAALSAAGLLTISRLGRLPVEERTLAGGQA